MKPSHRKDVILARLVFVIFCLAIISIVYSVGSHLLSRQKEEVAADVSVESEQKQESEADDGWKLTDSQAAELPAEPTETSLVVTTKSVNLRAEASTSASVLSVLPSKTELTLIETGDDGWAKVEYNGTTGYISAEYLKSADGENTDDTGSSTVIVKTTAKVKLRSGPSTDDKSLGTVPKGTELESEGEEDGWTKVTYNGKEGYIRSDYLEVQ